MLYLQLGWASLVALLPFPDCARDLVTCMLIDTRDALNLQAQWGCCTCSWAGPAWWHWSSSSS